MDASPGNWGKLSGTGDSQRDSRESIHANHSRDSIRANHSQLKTPIFIARQADSPESLEFPIRTRFARIACESIRASDATEGEKMARKMGKSPENGSKMGFWGKFCHFSAISLPMSPVRPLLPDFGLKAPEGSLQQDKGNVSPIPM